MLYDKTEKRIRMTVEAKDGGFLTTVQEFDEKGNHYQIQRSVNMTLERAIASANETKECWLFKRPVHMDVNGFRRYLLKNGFTINCKRIIWANGLGLRFERDGLYVMFAVGTAKCTTDDIVAAQADGITWDVDMGTLRFTLQRIV